MTQTLIEQLEKLQLYWPGNRGEMYPAMTKEGSRPRYVGANDLRAIIEQAKTEQRRIDACLKACDGISTENLEENDPLLSVVRKYNELLKQKSTPQPTPEDDWQPIYTVPKDRLVDILIDGKTRWSDCYYDRICEEFRRVTETSELVSIKIKHITHWRVIPALPAINAAIRQIGGGE